LEKFPVEVRWHRAESEFAFNSVRVPSLPLNSGVARIVEKTEGNPFFIGDTVQAMFDNGALVRDGTVKLTKSLSQLKIPLTVPPMATSD
jgi:predicted ATPase